MKYILVGAGARMVVMDRKYEAIMGRATLDWDLGIQVRSWEAFKGIKDAFFSGESSPFEPGGVEHRIIHKTTRVPLDIIPFGDIAGDDDTITWPKDENRMSVMGFQDVYAHSRLHRLNDLEIRVGSEPGLTMLKVFAFEDRKKRDDMSDFFFILDNYLQDEGLDEASLAAADQLISGVITPDELSPFVLGLELGKIISRKTYSKLTVLLKKNADPFSEAITTQINHLGAEREELAKRKEYAGKIDGFNLGIAASLQKRQQS